MSSGDPFQPTVVHCDSIVVLCGVDEHQWVRRLQCDPTGLVHTAGHADLVARLERIERLLTALSGGSVPA